MHEDEGAIGGDQLQRPGAVVPRALKPRKQDTFTCPLAVFEPPDPTKKAMYCKHKVGAPWFSNVYDVECKLLKISFLSYKWW